MKIGQHIAEFQFKTFLGIGLFFPIAVFSRFFQLPVGPVPTAALSSQELLLVTMTQMTTMTEIATMTTMTKITTAMIM